jgi:hypothetical protein
VLSPRGCIVSMRLMWEGAAVRTHLFSLLHRLPQFIHSHRSTRDLFPVLLYVQCTSENLVHVFWRWCAYISINVAWLNLGWFNTIVMQWIIVEFL